MVVVDSSVLIDYFADRPTPEVELLEGLIDSEAVGVGDLMLCEVLQGIRYDADFRKTREALLTLEVLDLGGRDVALKAADNYRALRRKGITVRGVVDCLIATFCIEHGHVLLHSDRDFDPFEQHLGLQVMRATDLRRPDRGAT